MLSRPENYIYIPQNFICLAYGSVKSLREECFFSSIILLTPSQFIIDWRTRSLACHSAALPAILHFAAVHLTSPHEEFFAFFIEFDLIDFRAFHQRAKITLNSNLVHRSAQKPFHLDVIHKFYSVRTITLIQVINESIESH